MTYRKINDLLLHNQVIASELEEALKRVLHSGWFALGPEVEGFEQNFASYCGTQYCKGVANGTDALEIGLRALGVEPGSEVITVANAGMYSSTAILAIGAKPVYADIEPDSFVMDAAHAESLIGPDTAALVVTHLFGRMADMPAFCALAEKHGIPLLEDCAQAHGASLAGHESKKAGSWGDVAAFSFYPTKNLGAIGDGGAIVTSSSEIHERIVRLRQYGWESKYRVVDRGGCNSRLDELQAAVLNVKLQHLDSWTQQRQQIGQTYSETINHVHVKTPEAVAGHVYHLYVLKSEHRDALQAHLKAHEIATDIHYPLLDYQQPVFAGEAISKQQLTNSEANVAQILTVPCYPELDDAGLQTVVAAINSWEL